MVSPTQTLIPASFYEKVPVKSIVEIDPGARIVMCSALGEESLVKEVLQAGAKDFIVKPFKPDAVIATLAKVVEKPE